MRRQSVRRSSRSQDVLERIQRPPRREAHQGSRLGREDGEEAREQLARGLRHLQVQLDHRLCVDGLACAARLVPPHRRQEGQAVRARSRLRTSRFRPSRSRLSRARASRSSPPSARPARSTAAEKRRKKRTRSQAKTRTRCRTQKSVSYERRPFEPPSKVSRPPPCGSTGSCATRTRRTDLHLRVCADDAFHRSLNCARTKDLTFQAPKRVFLVPDAPQTLTLCSRHELGQDSWLRICTRGSAQIRELAIPGQTSSITGVSRYTSPRAPRRSAKLSWCWRVLANSARRGRVYD